MAGMAFGEARSIAAALLAVAAAPAAAASHSFEYVAEHLPEAAMDNRLAGLPLWGGPASSDGAWQFAAQGAYVRVGSAGLRLDGPLASLAVGRRLNAQWTLRAFGFVDDLRFSGARDERPLQTLFATPPLALPAQALFSDLAGRYRNLGAGLAVSIDRDGWLGAQQWLAGALAQRVSLRGYRVGYRVLDGPSAGASGTVDYSASYSSLAGLLGIALPRQTGDWSWSPHALLALPLPRRGIQGRITGPGFDLAGDTASAGRGKHFNDPSLTIGLDLGFRPWGLSVDIGSALTQPGLERVAHKGIDRNWLLAARLAF